MFEGCERLDGSVVLRYGFPDRTNFRSLIVITGNFGGGGYVGEPLTLEGFDSLEVVEGQFTFFEDNLGEYSGVPRLRSVGGFRAGALPTLVDFHGLEGLQEVRGNFDISRNPKLQSFDGLEGLRHIHGDLSIGDNPVLPPEELDTFLERVTVDGEISLF